MSVFTKVSEAEARAWLKQYTIGALTGLEGIASGVENTNYFLSTTHGEFVLTLFEKLGASELPYYLDLMAHLARHGLPCALPIAGIKGGFLGELNGKPACIVTRLPGRPIEVATPESCAEVGELLAEMHLAGESYDAHMDNWRGLPWWERFVPQVQPLLDASDAKLLVEELQFQRTQDLHTLPRGVIHGDLFRDNVLFSGARISGVIDFYFACDEALLFDIAVTVNDWCIDEAGRIDAALAQPLLDAYHGVRPLCAPEHTAWPAVLCAAAYRSWLGRLGYNYFPQPGEMTHTKDHGHFRRILENHISDATTLRDVWVS
jgi:homoserine kinase type II